MILALSVVLTYFGQTGRLPPDKRKALRKKGKTLSHGGEAMGIQNERNCNSKWNLRPDDKG